MFHICKFICADSESPSQSLVTFQFDSCVWATLGGMKAYRLTEPEEYFCISTPNLMYFIWLILDYKN